MATYYVDATNGSNSDDGLSEATAWQTTTKVESVSLNPGDMVKFKRGELWREMFTPNQSGSLGSPIIFSAYGIGDRPKISGCDLLT